MALSKINRNFIEGEVGGGSLSYLTTGSTGERLGDLIPWSGYVDSASNNPVDGQGGSPSITLTRNTTNTLSGSGDLLITKDAVNRQGEGYSIEFDIENRHLATVLQIEADAVLRSGTYTNLLSRAIATYSVTSNVCTVTFSNTFTTGTKVTVVFNTGGATSLSNIFTLSGATSTTFTFPLTTANTSGNCEISYVGDLRVSIIQDPSGTPVLIEPVGTDIQLATTGLAVKILATFQTHISIKNYRLCIHSSGSTSNAFTVSFNNFRIWEQEKNYGAIITDWQSYTPTFINLGTSPSSDLYWRKVGANLEIKGRLTLGSSLPNSAGSFTTPNGVAIDSRLITTQQVGFAVRGIGTANQANILGTGGNSFFEFSSDGSGNALSNKSTTSVFNNSEVTSISLTVPIQGWGSNIALSSDAGSGRPVSGLATGHTGVSLTADVTNIIFNTIVKDSHGIYNTSTGNIIIPESGDYNFVIQGIRHTTGASYVNVSLWVGSTKIRTYSTTVANENIQAPIIIKATDLKAGEVVSFRIDATRTSATATLASISWEKSGSGSQILARDEVVACSYYSSANQTSLTTQINFGVRIYDTHGAVTTGAGWRFTSPKSSIYKLSGKIQGTNSIGFHLFKNNIKDIHFLTYTNSSGFCYISVDIKLNKDEFIDIRPNSSTTVTGGLISTTDNSYITISSIG
jgi:hypothetical protein